MLTEKRWCLRTVLSHKASSMTVTCWSCRLQMLLCDPDIKSWLVVLVVFQVYSKKVKSDYFLFINFDLTVNLGEAFCFQPNYFTFWMEALLFKKKNTNAVSKIKKSNKMFKNLTPSFITSNIKKWKQKRSLKYKLQIIFCGQQKCIQQLVF